jgi:hypothetical protein
LVDSLPTPGLVVRTLCTYLVMWGTGRPGDPAYSCRSRLFFAVAWTPKATVQAALSGAPLHLVRMLKKGQPDYQQWVTWGQEVRLDHSVQWRAAEVDGARLCRRMLEPLGAEHAHVPAVSRLPLPLPPQIQATGVVCVLVCATVGTLLVELLGPRLLDKVRGPCLPPAAALGMPA